MSTIRCPSCSEDDRAMVMVVAVAATNYFSIKGLGSDEIVAESEPSSWGADDDDAWLFCTRCGERWKPEATIRWDFGIPSSEGAEE